MTMLETRDSVREISAALAPAGITCVTLHELHAAAIRNALEKHNGNKTQAAKELGISLRTLQRVIKAGRVGVLDDSPAASGCKSG